MHLVITVSNSHKTDHFARPVKSKNPGLGVLQVPSFAYM